MTALSAWQNFYVIVGSSAGALIVHFGAVLETTTSIAEHVLLLTSDTKTGMIML